MNEAAFWSKVDRSSGCWLWIGKLMPNGYAQFGNQYVHRIAYELAKGPIPAGLEIDHTCAVRHCVNANHLQAVTHAENNRLGSTRSPQWGRNKQNWNAHKTHCPQGHLYDEANTWIDLKRGGRHCRACSAIRGAKRNALKTQRRRERGPAPSWAGRKTYCTHGHTFDEANTYRDPATGYRTCKTCRRTTDKRRHQRTPAGGRVGPPPRKPLIRDSKPEG